MALRLLQGGQRIAMAPGETPDEKVEFVPEFGDLLLDGGADSPSWLFRFVPKTLKDMDMW